MADHDESLLDKAKRALGMGDDQAERRADPGDTHEGMHEHSPGAGIGGARDDEIGMHTRRSGAEADAPRRVTSENQFPGSNYDTDFTTPDEDALVSGPLDDTSVGATADAEPDAPSARPEPPSGNSPYDPGEDTVESQRRDT